MADQPQAAPAGQPLPSPQPIIGTPPKSLPEVEQKTPGQAPQSGTSRDPKDAFQDPNSSHYLVELWAGTGSARFSFACSTDLSAAMGAFFLALKHQPEIHTFGVWKKQDERPDAPLESTVCFVAMAQMLAGCAPSIQALTGKQIATPAVPVVTTEAGFEELQKGMKDRQQRKPG